MTRLFLVRHGEVHNPEGIIYGRLPGFGLSERGRCQVEAAAGILKQEGPCERIVSSPMQRALETAAIIGHVLGLEVQEDERLVETDVTGYQGGTFADLPKPYITEGPEHEGIECAASIRRRFLGWVDDLGRQESALPVIAVSHRDPIIVMLLHWRGGMLDELPGYELEPGGVHEVQLTTGERPLVRPLG